MDVDAGEVLDDIPLRFLLFHRVRVHDGNAHFSESISHCNRWLSFFSICKYLFFSLSCFLLALVLFSCVVPFSWFGFGAAILLEGVFSCF